MEDNLQDFDNIIETAIDNHSFRKIPIQFDHKKCESIICIELKNNNHLYLRYDDQWTIREVNLLY